MGAWLTQIAATFIVIVLIGFIGWAIYRGWKKALPNLKFDIKYDLLKKKYKENEVEFLMDCLENKVSNKDLITMLLTTHPKFSKKSKEMIYIYDKMKKGGEET